MACSALIDKTNRNGLLSRMSFPGNFSAGMLGWQSGNFSWRGIVSSTRRAGLAGDAMGRNVGVLKTSFDSGQVDGLATFGLDSAERVGQDQVLPAAILWTLGLPFSCIIPPVVATTISNPTGDSYIRDNPCENQDLLLAF
ncbi:MAG: hypothetical protein CMJ62_05725 [Planctomycetaceae bacterium]|jgi:hypothetical protein|nr:hypothetical protein [Planctomycetaceae bacterium]